MYRKEQSLQTTEYARQFYASIEIEVKDLMLVNKIIHAGRKLCFFS